MSTAILYHAHCIDGFTAAWAIQRNITDDTINLKAVNHGNPMPPDVREFERVYIVDFSYPYTELVELGKHVDLTIWDHHQSAIDDIDMGAYGQVEPSPTKLVIGTAADASTGLPPQSFRAVLDPYRSGAGIAWDEITHKPRPTLVDYVEDRDLWNNRMEGTREVSAYLRTLECDLELWDELAVTPIEKLINLGKGCVTQLDAVIRAAVAESYMCEMGGRTFPITNVTYLAGSETAEALCNTWQTGMAGYYFRQADGRWKYGFRSRDDKTTVHDFASQFGGGGHPGASGATLDEIGHTKT